MGNAPENGSIEIEFQCAELALTDPKKHKQDYFP